MADTPSSGLDFADAIDTLTAQTVADIVAVLRDAGIGTIDATVDTYDNGWFLGPDPGSVPDDVFAVLDGHFATLSRLLHSEYRLTSTVTVTASGTATLDGTPICS